jgi:hypothetical protein
MGATHPLKGPLSREKPLLSKEDILSLLCGGVAGYHAPREKCLLLSFAESSAFGVDDSSPHRPPIRIWA